MVDLTPSLVVRSVSRTTYEAARDAGLDDLEARIVAGRVDAPAERVADIVEPTLGVVAPPSRLRDAASAARRLAEAIGRGETIGIATDYDVDGITSHALITEALETWFGVDPAQLRHYIGHRIRDGYGVSDNLADHIIDSGAPGVLITADCGSSDGPRIERLRAAGVDVIVTDHHALPADGPPKDAFATINPTRDDCDYPDPSIAGCMVSWLLMAGLRAQLIADGRLPANTPKLSGLLDLVGLGTVADAVTLASPINRAVVRCGLAVLNQEKRACWRAMRALSDPGPAFTTADLGFQLGPRINARGRLEDPHAALHFLRATERRDADRYLALLDDNNRERKTTEREMVATARRLALGRLAPDSVAIVAYDDAFHPGVQGIVASRLVDAFGRPAVVFSPARRDGYLTGSMRSVGCVHARRALQRIADGYPDLFAAFGGHAGAAGMTVRRDGLGSFERALIDAVREQIGDTRLGPVVRTDGVLPPGAIDADTFWRLDALEPYGRGFERPTFDGRFVVKDAKPVGADKTHLKLRVADDAGHYDAIWFSARDSADAPLPARSGDTLRCAYRLDMNRYRGTSRLQLVIRYGRSV